MKFTINDIEYKLFFKYSKVSHIIRGMCDKNDLYQTIISNGFIKVTEAILYNITDDCEIARGASKCQIFDKYDKRLGMSLAMRNLLKDVKSLSSATDSIIPQPVYETLLNTFFSYKKNIANKYLVESK